MVVCRRGPAWAASETSLSYCRGRSSATKNRGVLCVEVICSGDLVELSIGGYALELICHIRIGKTLSRSSRCRMPHPRPADTLRTPKVNGGSVKMPSSVLSVLLLCLFGIVQCLSTSGSRLLVLTDEPENKDSYSKLWADLQGMSSGYAD